MKLSPRVIAEFLIQGLSDVATLVKEGRFDMSMFWVGLAGAEKYIEAIAAGWEASEEVWLKRLTICGKCSSVTPVPSDPSKRVGYCGKALDPDMAADPPTCGCLVSGKARVSSEYCPQGKWGPCVPVGLTVSVSDRAKDN